MKLHAVYQSSCYLLKKINFAIKNTPFSLKKPNFQKYLSFHLRKHTNHSIISALAGVADTGPSIRPKAYEQSTRPRFYQRGNAQNIKKHIYFL